MSLYYAFGFPSPLFVKYLIFYIGIIATHSTTIHSIKSATLLCPFFYLSHKVITFIRLILFSCSIELQYKLDLPATLTHRRVCHHLTYWGVPNRQYVHRHSRSLANRFYKMIDKFNRNLTNRFSQIYRNPIISSNGRRIFFILIIRQNIII